MPYVIKPLRDGDGLVTEGVAGQTLSKYDLVFLSGGKWFKASAGASDTLPAYGLALSDLPLNYKGRILLYGLVSNLDWSWIDGPIYASATPGVLTQTAPTVSGWAQSVGVAHGVDYMLFTPLWIREVGVTVMTDPPDGKIKVKNLYVALVEEQPKLGVEYGDGDPFYPGGGLVDKAGIVNTGGGAEATVVFNTPYPNTNYFIMLTAGQSTDTIIVNVKSGTKTISGFTVVSTDDSGKSEINVDIYWATGPYNNP